MPNFASVFLMKIAATEPTHSWAKKWLGVQKKHFVGGSWQDGGKDQHAVVNPTDGSVLAKVPNADKDVVDRAVAAARSAFPSYAQLTRAKRAGMLREIGSVIRKHATELATLESLQNGMLWSESLVGCLPDSADIFDYFAGWTDKYYGKTVPVDPGFVNYTLRQPVGVCGAIVPWNFPLLLAMWKIAPALAMGNTVVVKPAEATPLSLIRAIELIGEHVDLPKGVLNLVLGNGETGAAMGSHPGIDKLSFTGSTAVGKSLVRGSGDSNLKRLTLELGGNSANIIFEDVPDLQAAIDRSFALTFSSKGEKCSEPTRLIVHESHYDNVISEMAKKADAVVCGNPFDIKSMQGPQCTEAHMNRVLDYIKIGIEEGAKVEAGGFRDEEGANAKGFFIRPTVLSGVDIKSRIAQEEVFGPVLTVHKFRDEDDAIRQANDTVYGLAAGLWTKDVSQAHRVAARLEAGMVFVNQYGCYDFASPFGGVKQSGWGKEMGEHVLSAYTQEKSIWIKV